MTEIELRSEQIERRKTEAAAARQRSAYAGSQSAVPLIIVYVIDQDGIFLMSDGRGLEAIDVQPNRIVGQFDLRALRQPIGHPSGVSTNARRRNRFDPDRTADACRVCYITKCAFHRSMTPTNQVIGAIAVATDVTERVWVEHTLEDTISA